MSLYASPLFLGNKDFEYTMVKAMKHALPETIALDGASQDIVKQKTVKLKKSASPSTDDGEASRVVYVGHIPHGFHETQMREYFKQFGDVTRLRISRSKKTGRIRGYAFVEFKLSAVAKIVAETMNNYLMFNRLLKCQLVPVDRLHAATFKHSERAFHQPRSHLVAAARHNSAKSDTRVTQNGVAMRLRKSKCVEKLAKLGIAFDVSGLFEQPTIADISQEDVPAESIKCEITDNVTATPEMSPVSIAATEDKTDVSSSKKRKRVEGEATGQQTPPAAVNTRQQARLKRQKTQIVAV